MGLHYDNPNPPGNDMLRTQRLTADEAAAVIALWQQERVEQTGLTDRPAVPDVAEGLDIPVEEVQRLLAEVRAQRLEEERALAEEQDWVKAEIRLATEKARISYIQQQRAELKREQTQPQAQSQLLPQWVQTKPGVWEDISQQDPPLLIKIGGAVAFIFLIATIAVVAYAVWGLNSMPHN